MPSQSRLMNNVMHGHQTVYKLVSCCVFGVLHLEESGFPSNLKIFGH